MGSELPDEARKLGRLRLFARLPQVPRPILIGAGAALVGSGLLAGAAAVTWLATHPVRLPVLRPRNPGEMPLLDVAFPSVDGLRLSGWIAPRPDAIGGVILCHGHPMNRTVMLPWARLLWSAGFNVLLFDFRAMGRSEGRVCSIGHHEVQDLRGATDYFTGLDFMRGLRCGVYGISMGGAVAILAAAEDERLAAVATHGAYSSLDRAIAQRGRLVLGPLGPLVSRPMHAFGSRLLGIDPCVVSPLAAVARLAPRPLLLFHGAKDRIVNRLDARALFRAAREPKQLHVLPRSYHVFIHPSERPDYDALLAAFFTKHLNGRN